MSLALRDEIGGTVGHWAVRSGLAVGQLLTGLGLPLGKYHAWQARPGLPNRITPPCRRRSGGFPGNGRRSSPLRNDIGVRVIDGWRTGCWMPMSWRPAPVACIGS